MSAANGGSAAADVPVIRAVRLTKRYGGLLANDRVDFSVRKGEFHALLGENGSGKTTLLSMLYGLIRPDDGGVFVRGQAVRHNYRQHVQELGIGMVPQRFQLVPTLTVAENVALTVRRRGRFRTIVRHVAEQIDAVQRRYGLDLDAGEVVGNLSMGERQRVEIVRALYFDPDVLLLDEPTSVLTPDEADVLYEALRRLVREENRAVVLTTHRIREVFETCDRVTVLRQGRTVGLFERRELSREALVKAMVGDKDMPAVQAERPTGPERVLLRVRDLTLGVSDARAAGIRPVSGISFDVHAGEVVGIAGVEGNGQITLERLVVGIQRPTAGQIELAGDGNGAASSVAQHARRDLRMGYVPSDRDRFGVVPSLTVRENLLLTELAERPLFGRAPGRGGDGHVRQLIREFNIEPPNPAALVQQLSGGNAQKVVLARELSRDPAVVLAAQPTAGLDVAAAWQVRSRLHEQARLGHGVVIISSDLDELLEICNRIAVLHRGRLVAVWERSAFDRQEIGAAMAGWSSP